MSGIMNKIKEAVHPSNPETETTGRHAGSAEYGSSATGAGANTGIHSQPAKAGEYGSSGASSGVGSHGLGSSEYSSTGRTGGAGGTGAMYGNPASQQTAGPHSSDAANKLDPRVDSDLDNSRTMGRDQTYSSGTGTTGAHTGYGSGTTGTHTGYGTGTGGGVLGSGNTHSSGPHASNAANKLDPRVDSDRDGSSALRSGQTYGSGTTGHGALGGVGSGTHTGTHTGYGNTHNAGPHSSSAANKLDPRIDSDRDGSNTAGRHHATTGIGAGAGGAGVGAGMGSSAGNFGNPASSNTAGPHSSDAMNKMDPRVDSDLDGSKTMGRDQTFSRSHESGLAGKNPRDAAQVPPSVMMHEIGAPEPLAEKREGHHNPFGHHGAHQEGSNRP